jgi:uncharacterized protein (UPF0147 family)
LAAAKYIVFFIQNAALTEVRGQWSVLNEAVAQISESAPFNVRRAALEIIASMMKRNEMVALPGLSAACGEHILTFMEHTTLVDEYAQVVYALK